MKSVKHLSEGWDSIYLESELFTVYIFLNTCWERLFSNEVFWEKKDTKNNKKDSKDYFQICFQDKK